MNRQSYRSLPGNSSSVTLLLLYHNFPVSCHGNTHDEHSSFVLSDYERSNKLAVRFRHFTVFSVPFTPPKRSFLATFQSNCPDDRNILLGGSLIKSL